MQPDLSIVDDLGLASQQVTQLDGRQRSRLLNYLLRWEHLDLLHSYLDVLLAARPNLVSLHDLRVRALVLEERFPEAITQMQKRLQIRASLSSKALMARVYLASDDAAAAGRIAEQLRADEPDSTTTWYLTAEVALAQDDIRSALAAYQRASDISGTRRRYLLGMMQLYQTQEDFVSASGYAVRLMATVEHPEELSIGYLRKLREFFVASDEQTHVHEIDDAIAARYARERRELVDGLGDEEATTSQPATPTHRADDESFSSVAATLSAGAVISITTEERRRISKAVQELFGFDDLLPGQLETMARVLRGENVLTILPTGGGKSLCYQVPAMQPDSGTTLVISPLIALMKDQVDSLPEPIRSRATTVNSSLNGDVLRQRLDDAARGAYGLLYAAPERLRQPTFLHALRRAGVSRLVVDEAHCVSVWGHDFRPDYLKLRDACRRLGEPPILALTATAPPRVRLDIIQHLSPDQPMAVVTGDLTRPNLRLEAFHARNQDEKLDRLLAICKSATGSGIIYARTRARCEELAQLLREQGINAAHYHAGIQNRSDVQDAFMTGQTRVIVATIAFGMGIDKPDIRFIVHYAPPASLESYYQEAGRAGRDGLPARCLLMYSSGDRGTMTTRMRRDLPTVDFLRDVYGAVRRHLGASETGTVATGDLERELGIDGTRIRVAISILEENDLLERGPDTPRAALVRAGQRPQRGNSEDSERLAAFIKSAHLQPNRHLRVDLVGVAQTIGLPPQEIEDQLIAWSDEGHLTCRFSGRDMLLTLLPAPNDVAARIDQWLDRFESLQVQRIAEIVAYARTRRCRHGHLNAYLGGGKITSCQACDNCIDVPEDASAGLPTKDAQLGMVLECVNGAPWSWGRQSLSCILRADKRASAKAQGYPGFGVLSYRSKSAVLDMIGQLENAGFLRPRQLDNGGTVLDITDRGRRALREPTRLRAVLTSKSSPAAPTPSGGPGQGPIPLLHMLSNWRLERAQRQGVPPFRILQLQILHRIAARQPQSPDALLAIKGIGPRKLEVYGDEILGIIGAYRSETASANRD